MPPQTCAGRHLHLVDAENPLGGYLFKGFRSENREGMPLSRKGAAYASAASEKSSPSCSDITHILSALPEVLQAYETETNDKGRPAQQMPSLEEKETRNFKDQHAGCRLSTLDKIKVMARLFLMLSLEAPTPTQRMLACRIASFAKTLIGMKYKLPLMPA